MAKKQTPKRGRANFPGVRTAQRGRLPAMSPNQARSEPSRADLLARAQVAALKRQKHQQQQIIALAKSLERTRRRADKALEFLVRAILADLGGLQMALRDVVTVTPPRPVDGAAADEDRERAGAGM